jgi:hypothetical protein
MAWWRGGFRVYHTRTGKLLGNKSDVLKPWACGAAQGKN